MVLRILSWLQGPAAASRGARESHAAAVDNGPVEVYQPGTRTLFQHVFRTGRDVQVWRSAGHWQSGWKIMDFDDKGRIVVGGFGDTKAYSPEKLLRANPELLPKDIDLNVRRSNGELESGWRFDKFDYEKQHYVMQCAGLTRTCTVDEILQENPNLLPPRGERPQAKTALFRVQDDLIGGWAQGKEGNCSSVAVIKAAMKTYGSDIFSEVRKFPGGHYHIRMRDGYQVSLTAGEIDRTSRESHFIKDFKGYPVVCFAAMAKRKAEEGDQGARDLDGALNRLNNGQDPHNSARLLGLAKLVEPIPLHDVGKYPAAVVWSRQHAVFAQRDGYEAYYDAWGAARHAHGTVVGKPAHEAFRFRLA